MIFGSLVDCLVTQPDTFDKHFYFPPEGAKLTSKEGAAAWLSLWGVPCPANFGEAKALALEMMEREQRSKITQALYNEGSKARTAGDNATARDKMSQAKVIIDQINQTLAVPMEWQMLALEGDWTEPGEYVDLGKFVTALASLEKMVRMGGGTK